MSLYYLFGSLNGESCCIVGNCVLLCDVGEYKGYNTCFQTSDMQFGFKQQHSTIMCSLFYHEVINHYLCNGSNVYNCLLDAIKAIDKVHYGTMLSILFKKMFHTALYDY